METPEQTDATQEDATGIVSRLKSWLYLNRWLMGMGLVVLGFYFVLDPVRFSPVPPCPMHTITGLECPGCGGQRALHALLRGDVATAWRFNPLVPVALPLLGYMVLRHVLRPGEPRKERSPLALWKIGVVALFLLAFTVYRNLPA